MDNKVYFKIISALGKEIRITKEYWNRIIETKHCVMQGKEELVKKTLSEPDTIRRSKKDLNVVLYYKKVNNYYSCVVAKHLNGDGFIITTYITNRIKVGTEYETN